MIVKTLDLPFQKPACLIADHEGMQVVPQIWNIGLQHPTGGVGVDTGAAPALFQRSVHRDDDAVDRRLKPSAVRSAADGNCRRTAAQRLSGQRRIDPVEGCQHP